jgi:hypothetical protein
MHATSTRRPPARHEPDDCWPSLLAFSLPRRPHRRSTTPARRNEPGAHLCSIKRGTVHSVHNAKRTRRASRRGPPRRETNPALNYVQSSAKPFIHPRRAKGTRRTGPAPKRSPRREVAPPRNESEPLRGQAGHRRKQNEPGAPQPSSHQHLACPLPRRCSMATRLHTRATKRTRRPRNPRRRSRLPHSNQRSVGAWVTRVGRIDEGRKASGP